MKRVRGSIERSAPNVGVLFRVSEECRRFRHSSREFRRSAGDVGTLSLILYLNGCFFWKNLFDSTIETLLDTPSKTKDGLKSHKDLVNMQLREELHHMDKAPHGSYRASDTCTWALYLHRMWPFEWYMSILKGYLAVVELYIEQHLKNYKQQMSGALMMNYVIVEHMREPIGFLNPCRISQLNHTFKLDNKRLQLRISQLNHTFKLDNKRLPLEV
uniref:Uncharacterized protein n=2 Tax=Oryza sativa subsp. japonica TaxID=39947 RepID=Q84QY5_ORYSJ|nr:hypothetical protein [Oryza sativa Japonica Group]ABF96405.1 hypothetical protein LOC_Os03g27700 [Oryza sativa Japonica Group]